jgi:hypothetical protein
MSAPDDPTREQPAVEPTVSTEPAPGRPRGWWSAIPRHLGRARTSTLVLAVLFLAIGTLYLYVKPDPVASREPAGGDSGVTEPADPGGEPTTEAPPPSEEPAPTTPVEPAPTEETTTDVPTESTVPSGTTPSAPAPTAPTTPVPTEPTTAEPTG